MGRPDDGKPIGTKADLYRLDLASGEIDCRTAGLDVGVGGRLSMDMPVSGLSLANLLVSEDGAYAFANVQRGGTDHVYRIALQGEEQWEAVSSGDCAVFPLDLRGEALLYARTDLNMPPDLFVADAGGGDARRLTSLNAEHLGVIDRPETERLEWPGVDGVLVEGWYMKPARGEAPYPTILYIHGDRTRPTATAFILIFRCWRGRVMACYFSITAPRLVMAMASRRRSRAIGAIWIIRT